MKKLISILAAISMVMMFGTMAFATQVITPCGDCDAEVGVAITVTSYVALLGVTSSLVMTVNDIQAPGGSPVINEGTHQATTEFTVQGNVAMNIVLTVNEATDSVIYTPGSLSGDPWPTARLTSGTEAENLVNAIGYGLQLSNLTVPAVDGWNPVVQNCNLAFGAGASTGKILINTYLDSGRSDLPAAGLEGGNLARPGLYEGTVFLTLSAQ